MNDLIVLTIFASVTLTLMLSYQARIKEKDAQYHEERLFLLQQAERERNQLLNRSMAKDLGDYRQSVALESQAGANDEVKLRDNLLDETYGPEWREMV